MRAFAGESQARNRYTFAASVCRQQKLHVVEAVFRFTADQEKSTRRFLQPHERAGGPDRGHRRHLSRGPDERCEGAAPQGAAQRV
ncbi:MAG: ferritin family protein [Dysosmobacter welbionis]